MEPLEEFLGKHSDTDVFCFQEVYDKAAEKDTVWKGKNPNLLDDLKRMLPNHSSIYHPHLGDWWGLSMFIKKNNDMVASGEHYVHLLPGHNIEIEMQGYTAKNVEYATLASPRGALTVVNFHGLWNGGGKTDTEPRLKQSDAVIEFLSKLENPYVICGDFNLLPETESLQKFPKFGLRDLVAEHGVTSTRTKFYTKEMRFADYAFTSPGLKVADFKVLPDEVSDHSPLYIELG